MSYMEPDELDEGASEIVGDEADSTPADEQPSAAQPEDSEPKGEEPATDPTLTGKAGAEAAPTAGEFDLGGVKIKGLSPEQVKALEGGVLRNKDYTTKLQRFHAEYKKFTGIVQAAQANPMELRKYFTPEHLRAALGESPSAAPTSPTRTDGKDEFEQFEPEAANILRSYKQEIGSLKGQLNDAIGKLNKFGEKFETADQMQAQNDLAKEVGDAMAQFPILNQGKHKEYNRQLILMKIAANPNRSGLEIAHEIAETWAAGETPTAGSAPTKVVGPGQSMPLSPKRPKTLEEADKQAHARFGVTYVK